MKFWVRYVWKYLDNINFAFVWKTFYDIVRINNGILSLHTFLLNIKSKKAYFKSLLCYLEIKLNFQFKLTINIY